MNFDIAIIGAGVTGSGIAYELSKFNLNIALIDAYNAPTQGASKANSGILHAGYDDDPALLRGQLVVRGNKLYDTWKEEIGFRLRRDGSLVVAFDDEQFARIQEEKARGEAKGIPGLEIWDQAQLRHYEPNLNEEAIAALYAPTAGVVCPMEVTNFLFRNAVSNGVIPFMDQTAMDFEKSGDELVALVTSREKIYAKIFINAAGVYGDMISRKAGIDAYTITARKGEYILLEPNEKYNVHHIIFPSPTKTSKGVLVTKAITGDILLGPNAVDMPETEKSNNYTTHAGLEEVLEKTRKLVPTLSTKLAVKTFAGLRPQPNTNDFILEDYAKPANFINAIGIRSPGLTAAPAIAEYVVHILERKAGPLPRKTQYDTIKRTQFDPLARASQDPAWGKTLTPHLDSAPLPLLELAWDFGVRNQLYNFTCYADLGLGVDLGASWQNQLIQWIANKGLPMRDILYRHTGSWQIKEVKNGV